MKLSLNAIKMFMYLKKTSCELGTLKYKNIAALTY